MKTKVTPIPQILIRAVLLNETFKIQLFTEFCLRVYLYSKWFYYQEEEARKNKKITETEAKRSKEILNRDVTDEVLKKVSLNFNF